MATYTVTIESSPGNRDASPNLIVFNAGDTVTFTADVHGANLCLTPATAAILSPAPGSLSVPIAARASVTYTLTSASAGAYAAQVMPDDVGCAASIDGGSAAGGAVLVILSGRDPGSDTPPPIDPGNLDNPPPPPSN